MGERQRKQLYWMLAKWGISYIILTAIAIAIISYPSKRYSRELESELDYINNMHLMNTQKALDENYMRLVRFCERMNIEDESIGKLLKESDFDSVSRYLLYESVRTIRNASMHEPESFEFMIYYPVLDMVISDDYYADSRYYYQVMLSSLGFSYDDLGKVLGRKGVGTMIHELSSGSSHMIAITRPLNSSRELGGRAIAIMLFNLNDALAGVKDNEAIAIYDRNSDLFISSSAVSEENIKGWLADGSEGYMTTSFDGYLVSSIPSAYCNWIYIAVSENSESFGKVARLNSIVILSLIVFVAVSSAIMVRSLVRSYRPLRESMEALPDAGVAERKANDVLGFLGSSIRRLASRNQELGSVVQHQQERIESDIKRRLLTEPDAAERIGLDSIGRFGIGNGDFSAVIAFKELSDGIRRAMDSLIEKYGISGMDYEDFDVYMLWAGSRDILTDASLSIVRELRKDLPDCYIAMSGVHQAPSGFYRSFKEAMFVFSYQKMQNDPDTVVYGQLNMLPSFRLPEYPIEMENMLLQYIQAGEGEKAIEELRSIFRINYEETLHPESFEFLMSMILGGVLRIAGNGLDDVTAGEYRLFISRDSRDIARSTESLERFILKVAESKSNDIRRRKENQKDQLYSDVRRYVEENYMRTEMNVGYIADRFGISSASLSSLFNEMGEDKLSQYINRVRLHHAKEMLLDGVPLERAASECGYSSFRTFLRVFKQYEGLTPTQYKVLHQAMQKEERNEEER